MRIEEKLQRQLENSAKESWDWVRQLPEYRTAYQDFKKRLKRSPVTKHFFTRRDLWEICSDYELRRQQGLEALEYVQKISSVWHFYPLLNPSKQKLPKRFLVCFAVNFVHIEPAVELHNDLFGDIDFQKNRKDAKWFKNYLFRMMGSDRKAPKNIFVSINLSRDKDTIKKELLKLIDKYKPEPERPNYSDLTEWYKARVLKGLGNTHSAIAKMLFPHDTDQRAACKKVDRRLA